MFDQTLAYLDGQAETKPKDDLLALAIEDVVAQEKPEMPEPYAILLQLRRFGYTGWSSGGYEDQPHILLEELNRASEAEAQFKYKQELNQRNTEDFMREYSEKMKPGKRNGA